MGYLILSLLGEGKKEKGKHTINRHSLKKESLKCTLLNVPALRAGWVEGGERNKWGENIVGAEKGVLLGWKSSLSI